MKPIVKVVEQETEVTVTMTLTQALAVARVLASIGGSPTLSRRKHIQALLESLSEAGIKWTDGETDFQGSGYFLDRQERVK